MCAGQNTARRRLLNVAQIVAGRSPNMAREKIILGCTECKNRNYFTMKNKRLHPERVEWKKYCPRCNKHITHKETK